jgi:multiple sugar transport system substrate-binding protein
LFKEEIAMRPLRNSLAPLLLAALLVACGAEPPGAQPSAAPDAGEAQPSAAPATGEKVTLTMWIFEGEEAFLPRLKEEFEKAHPNIVLEITEIPEDQYVTKIDTALAANDPPDIGFVYGGQQRWLKAGKFLPLDELFKERGIRPEDYNQNAMSLYCLFEGKNYCIGSYTGAVLLFYNKALFDQVGVPYPSATQPMTIDEYATLAARLSTKSDDINQRVWGGSSGTTYWYMDWATHYSQDGRKAEGFVNDASTVHTYDVLAKLVRDGYAPSDADMQLLGDVDILAQGKQAMAITDNFAAIASLEAQGIPYGAAPPPVEQDGDQPFIITWTDAFGVFSQSDHPREAQEFLAFLGTEGNKLRVEVDTLPLNMKLAQELKWDAKNDGRKESLQAIQTARPVIFVPGFYEITGGPAGDAFNAMVEETSSPQEAMDAAAQQIQDGLDKAWETWEQIE